LVPAAGLRATEMFAVGLNAIAGTGALVLSVRLKPDSATTKGPRTKRSSGGHRRERASERSEPQASGQLNATAFFAALALARSGFAGMGMEILWFRHFTILLGGFRAVFSLLLTIILLGMASGAMASTLLSRRFNALVVAPARSLIVVQGL